MGYLFIHLFEEQSLVAQVTPPHTHTQFYRVKDDTEIDGGYKIEIFFSISFILSILGGFLLSFRCPPPLMAFPYYFYAVTIGS